HDGWHDGDFGHLRCTRQHRGGRGRHRGQCLGRVQNEQVKRLLTQEERVGVLKKSRDVLAASTPPKAKLPSRGSGACCTGEWIAPNLDAANNNLTVVTSSAKRLADWSARGNERALVVLHPGGREHGTNAAVQALR